VIVLFIEEIVDYFKFIILFRVDFGAYILDDLPVIYRDDIIACFPGVIGCVVIECCTTDTERDTYEDGDDVFVH